MKSRRPSAVLEDAPDEPALTPRQDGASLGDRGKRTSVAPQPDQMRRGSTLLLLSRSLRLASGESELSLAPGWQPELPFAKKVVFIRHAEGIHNRDAKEIPNYFADKLGYGMTYWDAELTPTGREQCALLSKVLPEQAGVLDLVAVSPLTRTLRTAALAFPNASTRPPFFATSLARERIALHTCDGRRRALGAAVGVPVGRLL